MEVTDLEHLMVAEIALQLGHHKEGELLHTLQIRTATPLPADPKPQLMVEMPMHGGVKHQHIPVIVILILEAQLGEILALANLLSMHPLQELMSQRLHLRHLVLLLQHQQLSRIVRQHQLQVHIQHLHQHHMEHLLLQLRLHLLLGAVAGASLRVPRRQLEAHRPLVAGLVVHIMLPQHQELDGVADMRHKLLVDGLVEMRMERMGQDMRIRDASRDMGRRG
jgi:hypothetical protein